MHHRFGILAVLLASFVFLILPLPTLAQARHQGARPLIVVLDPGHGGSDIGAADPTGTLVEKVLTLQVALRARSDLQTMGYRVYLDRTRDQDVNKPPHDLNHDGAITKVDEYDARTLYANRHHADVFVSIHFDASSDPSVHGTHGYYCRQRPFWRQSQRLATLLTGSIAASLQRADYPDTNNGVETDVADVVPQQYPDYPWFFVLGPSWPHRITGTAMPGALIETLYLTSPRDAAALRRGSTLTAIARGYADGIRAFFGGQTTREVARR